MQLEVREIINTKGFEKYILRKVLKKFKQGEGEVDNIVEKTSKEILIFLHIKRHNASRSLCQNKNSYYK